MKPQYKTREALIGALERQEKKHSDLIKSHKKHEETVGKLQTELAATQEVAVAARKALATTERLLIEMGDLKIAAARTRIQEIIKRGLMDGKNIKHFCGD